MRNMDHLFYSAVFRSATWDHSSFPHESEVYILPLSSHFPIFFCCCDSPRRWLFGSLLVALLQRHFKNPCGKNEWKQKPIHSEPRSLKNGRALKEYSILIGQSRHLATWNWHAYYHHFTADSFSSDGDLKFAFRRVQFDCLYVAMDNIVVWKL